MKKLKVKKENLPQRCEICHQDDCFDPVSNSCTRCMTVALVKAPSSTWRNFSVNTDTLRGLFTDNKVRQKFVNAIRAFVKDPTVQLALIASFCLFVVISVIGHLSPSIPANQSELEITLTSLHRQLRIPAILIMFAVSMVYMSSSDLRKKEQARVMLLFALMIALLPMVTNFIRSLAGE